MVVFGGSYGIGADIAALAASYGATSRRSAAPAPTPTSSAAPTSSPSPSRCCESTGGSTSSSPPPGSCRAARCSRPARRRSTPPPRSTTSRRCSSPRCSSRTSSETGGSLLLFTSSTYTRGRSGYSLYSSAKAAVGQPDPGAGRRVGRERRPGQLRQPRAHRHPDADQGVRRGAGGHPAGLRVGGTASLDVLLSAQTGHIVDLRKVDPLSSMLDGDQLDLPKPPNRAFWSAEPCFVVGRTGSFWSAEPCVVVGEPVHCGRTGHHNVRVTAIPHGWSRQTHGGSALTRLGRHNARFGRHDARFGGPAWGQERRRLWSRRPPAALIRSGRRPRRPCAPRRRRTGGVPRCRLGRRTSSAPLAGGTLGAGLARPPRARRGRSRSRRRTAAPSARPARRAPPRHLRRRPRRRAAHQGVPDAWQSSRRSVGTSRSSQVTRTRRRSGSMKSSTGWCTGREVALVGQPQLVATFVPRRGASPRAARGRARTMDAGRASRAR